MCDSGVSWEDCEHVAQDLDCTEDADERCLDLEVRVAEGMFYYHKTCARKEFCDTFCDYYKAQRIPCNVKCCEGDLCNEGSDNRPS